MFDALEKTGNANFHELIQVAGGDGQKFHTLEQRIIFIAGLFEDAPVKLQPLQVPIKIVTRIFQRDSFHRVSGSEYSYCRLVTER
jgi:hypothetical protein